MPCGIRGHSVSAVYIEVARLSARGRPLLTIALGEVMHTNVCHREVISGVLRHFPNQLRVYLIDDDLTAEVGTHPLSAAFDFHLCRVTHRFISFVTGSHAFGKEPQWDTLSRRAPYIDKNSGETRLLIGPYIGTVGNYSSSCSPTAHSSGGCPQKERSEPVGAMRGPRKDQ